MKIFKILLFSLLFHNLYAQSLPEFKLIDLNGNLLSKEDLKGKNVYINIFESWCGACITEVPILNETQKNLKDVMFVALTPANHKKAQNFQKKYGFNMQVFPNADVFCKQLNIKHYPTHFFIDKNGKLSEIKFSISVTWKRKDYENEKPPKAVFEQLIFEQNKTKLEDELRLFLQ